MTGPSITPQYDPARAADDLVFELAARDSAGVPSPSPGSVLSDIAERHHLSPGAVQLALLFNHGPEIRELYIVLHPDDLPDGISEQRP
ncbi:MAG: hypothetical protein V1735_02020 [Nanoarchaeota archaeon]